MILSKLGEEDLAKIVDQHVKLSHAIGFTVGIHSNSEMEKKQCLVDESQVIVDACINPGESTFVKS